MKNLSDLPCLTINNTKVNDENLKEHYISGYFNKLNTVHCGMSYLLSKDHYYYCELISLDKNKLYTVLKSTDENIASLQKGDILPWLDAYWNPNLIFEILDKGTIWIKEIFIIKDAQGFLANGINGYCEVGENIPKDSQPTQIIQEGWDHEHCEICNKKIGKEGEKFGYHTKDEEIWLCPKCFKDYASKQNLAFLFG
jgi:hypothetical protein